MRFNDWYEIRGYLYGVNEENSEFGDSEKMLDGHLGYTGRVFVHRNLNKPPYWSIKARGGEKDGLVIGYDTTVHLADVEFVVQGGSG